MGALLPLLLPAIPSLIRLVEQAFTGKPKSGPEKLAAVLQGLRGLVGSLVGSLEAPGAAQPTDDALHGVIETVLAQMKAAGALAADATAGTGDTLYLLRGKVTKVE